MNKLLGGCPQQYIEILKSINKTKFFDEPEYFLICKLLREAIKTTKSIVSFFSQLSFNVIIVKTKKFIFYIKLMNKKINVK